MELENDFNVIGFDAILFEDNKSVLVISSEEQNQLAKFTLFLVDPEGKIYYKSQQSANLIPGVKALHDEIDFDCALSTKASNSVDCIHSEKNLKSYFVKYQVNLPEDSKPWDPSNFVTSYVSRTLNNLVNFKPVRSVIDNGFAAVVATNTNFKKENKGIFGEENVLIIYSQTYQSDPYRIMTAQDLGLPSQKSLLNLWPFFFTQKAYNTRMLGVNVGTAESSVRVFNMDELAITV